MSIREQVEDADFLERNGRHIGALTMLLLAVAASSRLTFPTGTQSTTEPGKPMSDGEAFKLFLGGRIRKILFGDFGGPDAGDTGIGVEFRGEQHDVAQILYKFYRCELVHDGHLPEDVEFVSPGGLSPSMTISSGVTNVTISSRGKMVLDYGWLALLKKAVTHARCNGSEFGIKHYDLVALPGTDEGALLTGLVGRYRTSLGRVAVLKGALHRLSPSFVIAGSFEEVAAKFRGLVESGEINGGAITGLSGHGLTDRAGGLTARGIDLLRELAAGYELVEVR